jgi:hypothetical protein
MRVLSINTISGICEEDIVLISQIRLFWINSSYFVTSVIYHVHKMLM